MHRASSSPPRDKRSLEPASNPYESITTALLLSFILLVVAIDLATNRRYWISVVLLVVPGLAGNVCSVRRTAVLGGLTVAALVLLYGIAPRKGTVGDWLTIISAAAVSALCVVICRWRLQRERALVRARVTLEALQRTLLQALPIQARDVEVHGFYAPAEAEFLVGGDIYEVVETPYGTRLLIGDVQGKGMDAIQAGSAVLSAFRESGYHRPTLSEVGDRLEQAVARHNRRAVLSGLEERFVTAMLAEFAADGSVTLIDCGHPAPLLISGGQVSELDCEEPGVPLGLAPLTGRPRGARRIELPEGDALLLCTDGVLEARNTEGNFYPLLARLGWWAPADPATLTRELRADLDRYAEGHLADDAAALFVRRRPRA